MVDIEMAHDILLSMPNVVEDAHFAKPSYKIKGKIFATFNIENRWLTVRLMPDQQVEFCQNNAIYPVPNKWGVFGWTHVDLNRINKTDLLEVLQIAYMNVMPKKKPKI